MQKKKGFTLIEIMVVVAIIGILVSIAIPAYHNHVIRARVMEGFALASSAKLAVAEAVVASGGGMPSGNIAHGFVAPEPTENVQSVSIDQNTGEITITYTAKAGDGTIVMVPTAKPTGQIIWSCKEGTLPAKYRPSQCR